jgi:hypothetical protein
MISVGCGKNWDWKNPAKSNCTHPGFNGLNGFSQSKDASASLTSDLPIQLCQHFFCVGFSFDLLAFAGINQHQHMDCRTVPVIQYKGVRRHRVSRGAAGIVGHHEIGHKRIH